MPLEINEVEILMRVCDDRREGRAGSDLVGESAPEPFGGPDTEQIVQQCVSRVLRILAKLRER